MTDEQRYLKKRVLLSILRRIERVNTEKNFIARNIKKIVGLGVLLSLAFPAQGLGTNDFKGTSILVSMGLSYWELAFCIAFLFTCCCVVGHLGWKLENTLYLKELNAEKAKLMRELGMNELL